MIRTYYYCDRCGAEFSLEERAKCLCQLKPLRIDKYGKYYFSDKDKPLDLCFVCSKHFEEWLTEYTEDLSQLDF